MIRLLSLLVGVEHGHILFIIVERVIIHGSVNKMDEEKVNWYLDVIADYAQQMADEVGLEITIDTIDDFPDELHGVGRVMLLLGREEKKDRNHDQNQCDATPRCHQSKSLCSIFSERISLSASSSCLMRSSCSASSSLALSTLSRDSLAIAATILSFSF